MKKSAFKITIPKPCHENWQAMTPEAKGRFCQKCAKTVHDFSQKTDRQIAKIYQDNDGKVCGRFHKKQLNRSIAPYKPAPKQGNWTMAGMVLSGVLAVGQVDGQNCSSEIKGKVVMTEKVEEQPMLLGKMAIEQPPIIISGKMTDENEEPLIGGTVRFVRADIFAITDVNGDYHIEIPKDYEEKEIVINFSYTGFEHQSKSIHLSGNQQLDVILSEVSYDDETLMMMGFVVPFPILKEEKSFLTSAKQSIKQIKERLIEKRNQTNPKLKPQSPAPENLEVPDFIAPNPIIPPHFIQKIYPNPFVDYLKIEIHSAKEEILEFVLYDVNGRTVFKQKNEILIGTNLVEMDFNQLNLMEGNYFVSIFQNGEIVQTEMVWKTNIMRP